MAKSFEDNITRLEEIVSQLERGDAKLADSLKLFEEGTKATASFPLTPIRSSKGWSASFRESGWSRSASAEKRV